MLEPTVVRVLEDQRFIDQAADPVQRAVRGVLDRAPGLAYVLHGNWLGHPLHAALVAIPVGSWTAGIVLDLVSLAPGGRKLQRAADLVTVLGLGGALVAAVAGLADWSVTHKRARRVGFVHGAANMIIAGLYAGSVVARGRGSRKVGIALSGAGFTLALGSAWLGGELAYRYGVGVRPTALDTAEGGEAGRAYEQEPPRERVAESATG